MRAFWADLWRRRWFRWTFTPVASIALSWFCICLILNYVGERRWQKVKARLEAGGERTDYFALLPPLIPDEQNFCAIEALDGIQTPEGTDEISAVGQRKRDAIAGQSAYIEWHEQEALQFDPLNDGSVPTDQTILTALSLTGLPGPGNTPSLKTWQELKADIEEKVPILVELYHAVERRPLAEYLPRPKQQEFPEISMSSAHLYVCRDLGAVSRIYSVVCLRCGDIPGSLRAALISLRLAQAAGASYPRAAMSMSIAHQSDFLSLAWIYLEGRHLDDAGLVWIQKELRRIDPAAAFLKSSRELMALSADYCDYHRTHRWRRWTVTKDFFWLRFSMPDAVMTGVGAVLPSGFFELNKASDISLQYDHIIQPLKTSGLRHLEAEVTKWHDLVYSAKTWQRPDLFMTMFSMSSEYRAVMMHENQRLQTLLACTLERHFLRHGSYPSRLGNIDPEYSSGLSLVDVKGEEFHYTLTAKGRFKLWSGGPDGVDDGGRFGSEMHHVPHAPHEPTYRGDWVWRYEPAIKAP